jgi:replicative DNA helicase
MVNSESGLTVAEIARHARDMQRALRGLDAIMIDHIGYINHLGEKHDNLPTRIGLTTKSLARIGKQMNVAVLALCQLNRDKTRTADKPPTLTDLRDSGHLEADARMVLALHRPEYFTEVDSVDLDAIQDASIIVLKNHRGPRNVRAQLQFIESSAQFSEAVP